MSVGDEKLCSYYMQSAECVLVLLYKIQTLLTDIVGRRSNSK